MAQSSKSLCKVKRIRQRLGLTQRQLANELGVSPAAVALWEQHLRIPSGPVEKLLRLYEIGVLPLTRKWASQ